MVERSVGLVVVSHACVLAGNQEVYAALAALGVPCDLIVPARWRNEYQPGGFDAQEVAGLAGHVHRVRTIGQGRPQRHLALARCAAMLRTLGATTVLIEEEPFSLPAYVWSRAARHIGVPYGVQLAETLDRTLPVVVRRSTGSVLRHAAFVAARSPKAAALARRWGATGEVLVVPHSVAAVAARDEPTGQFTVAFVGRLVDDKGVGDLLEAIALLRGDVRLLVAGDGPLAPSVRAAGAEVTLLGPVRHDRIGDVYGAAHVTCVPSRTTPSWEEQFGRVIVESLIRGVPVIASSSGEIPWVLSRTGGGTLVAERDPQALADAIRAAAADREATSKQGRLGRTGAVGAFSNEAVAAELATALAALTQR